MRYMKILFLLITTIYLISCNKNNDLNYSIKIVDGVTVIMNSKRPASPSFIPILKENYFLNLDTLISDERYVSEVTSLQLDKDNNLFILDRKACRIHKYNSDGKFIKTFGRRGQGPGEFSQPFSIFITRDTLYLSEGGDNKVILYNLEGDFLYQKQFNENEKIPSIVKRAGENYVGINSLYDYDKTKEKIFMVQRVNLYDPSFNLKSTITQFKNEIDLEKGFNPMEKVINFACSDSLVYISIGSIDKYEIQVYDLKGDLKSLIKKKYNRILIPKEELEFERKFYKKHNQKDIKKKYRVAIFNINIDNNGYLWVATKNSKQNEKGYYIDIFKNNIFMSRFSIHDVGDKGYPPIFFLNNYLIGVSDDSNLKIYDYHFEE